MYAPYFIGVTAVVFHTNWNFKNSDFSCKNSDTALQGAARLLSVKPLNGNEIFRKMVAGEGLEPPTRGL